MQILQKEIKKLPCPKEKKNIIKKKKEKQWKNISVPYVLYVLRSQDCNENFENPVIPKIRIKYNK